jgi:hypothetical protein
MDCTNPSCSLFPRFCRRGEQNVTGIIGLYESVLHVCFLDFVGEANNM